MATQSDDSNYHPWKKNAWQSRQAVSEALVALPKHYSPQRAVAVSEYHELAQTYLFEYFSVFEPKKDQFGGDLDPEDADEDELAESLWWEPLLAVPVPVDGQVRLNGSSDVLKGDTSDRAVLSEAAAHIPERRVTVRLGNLRRLFQTNNTFQISVKGWLENKGPVSRTVIDTRYLPISGILAVRSQLDACLEYGGWLPEITPNTGDGVITEEDVQFAPDEVKERILPDGET